MAVRSSSAKMRLRNGVLALVLAGIATAPPPPPDPAPGGDGSITLTVSSIPVDQQFYQRDDAGFYDVPVQGTTTGTNAVQARVVDSYSNAVVVDWTNVAIPSGGNYSGTIRTPARLQSCKLQVRDSVNTASTGASTNRFFVGAFYIMWGQSNMVNWPGGVAHYPNGGRGAIEYVGGVYRRLGWIADSYPPSSERNGIYSSLPNPYDANVATNENGSKGDGWVYFANTLSAKLNCAVCLVNSSSGGKGLSYWAPGAQGWTDLVAAVTAIGGKAEGAVLYQGEADASAVTTQAAYETMLADRQGQFHTLLGRTAANFKYGIVGLGATNSGGGYTTSMANIRAAQMKFANNTPGAFLLAANHDCTTSDGIHVVGESFGHLGAAGGLSAAAQYGIGPSGAGPRVTDASRVGPAITMAVQHSGGTTLKDGSGGTGTALTGFRVFLASDTNKTTPLAIASTAIPSNTSIRVTLAADPGAAVVIDYGLTPCPHSPDQSSATVAANYASAVYDNVVLPNQARGCILQPFAAINVTGS